MRIAIGRRAILCLCLGGYALCAAQFLPSVNAPSGRDADAARSDAQSGVATTQPPSTYTLSPERAAQAISYDRAAHQFYWVDFAYSVVLLLLLLHFRAGPRFRDWAERATGNRFSQAVIFVSAFQLTFALLEVAGRCGQPLDPLPLRPVDPELGILACRSGQG